MSKEYSDSELQNCFEMGHDYKENGADEVNCNFQLFSTPEKTKAWEHGHKNGK